ncbi:MAG TPA: hypothetical protein PLV51_10910, partial [Lentimicrobium sp.]|nr:hypothetical protein [Lentimicrobium sp.]
MKKFVLFFLAASLAVLTACNDENDNFSVPAVSVPEPAFAEFGKTIELEFNYTAEAGFKSSAVTAVNGTAQILADGESGSKSGTVTISFTAGTQAGAGSVVLTVFDKEDRPATRTAVVSVLAEQIVYNVEGN